MRHNSTPGRKFTTEQGFSINQNGTLTTGSIFETIIPKNIESHHPLFLSVETYLSGFIFRNPTGGADTTPYASAIIAAIPNAAVGSSFLFHIRNIAGGFVSLFGGLGVTIHGSVAVPRDGVYTVLNVISSLNPPLIDGFVI